MTAHLYTSLLGPRDREVDLLTPLAIVMDPAADVNLSTQSLFIQHGVRGYRPTGSASVSSPYRLWPRVWWGLRATDLLF